MRALDANAGKPFGEKIRALAGRAAGVVYGFQGAGNFNRIWYDHWGSAVISSYGQALEYLGMHPFFVEVETYCKLAFQRQLPDLACIFNLNAGITPISHWSVVPSVSSWFNIPSFPASADTLTVCERKDTASLLAAASNLHVPITFSIEELMRAPPDQLIIIKPRDLGGSVGIKRMRIEEFFAQSPEIGSTDIIQEFIPGYDLTIPVVLQPSTAAFRCPAGVLYIPDDINNTDWWHGLSSKRSGTGYSKKIIEIPNSLQESIAMFAQKCQLGPYSRIDFRVLFKNKIGYMDFTQMERATFIEVNPLPTLRPGINFLNVIDSTLFRSAFEIELMELQKLFNRGEIDSHALILACSLYRINSVQSQA